MSKPINDVHPSTLVALCTMRLECSTPSQRSVGTGFLYRFEISIEKNGTIETLSIPTVVTNRHVIESFDTLDTTLTLIPSNSKVDDSLTISNETYQNFTLQDLQSHAIYHPDSDIDLAILPFEKIVSTIPGGKQIKLFSLGQRTMLPENERDFIRAIEPVVMAGYPNGLWDEVNNRAIIRKGITASHALHKWNGERKFVIDMACFPGSSGSPVFLFEDGITRTSQDNIEFGTRADFLGILFAGPIITQEGHIEQKAIPTSTSYISITKNMMNLGFVIHAEALNDFIPLIEQAIKPQ